jgi:hypothetical protein
MNPFKLAADHFPPARRPLVTLTAALLALCATAAVAAPDHYHDGTRKVPITLQADLVAEFTPARARAAALPAAGGGEVLAGDSLVRIRRVGSSSPLAAAAAAAAGRSPVFRQGAAANGRLMALPGGVLVKFHPDWTRERIDAWLAARGHLSSRPMAWSPQWFRVDTAHGLPALEAANAMAESGEVLAASPNWWMQTVTR